MSDQLQPEDTLIDRGVDDILDEGISPPEGYRGSTAKGVTVAEERAGETLDERIAQEEPEPTFPDADRPADDERADPADSFAGDARTGRLVEPDEGWREDTEKAEIASDVGIDGGAAGAEEAAVHTQDT